MSEGMSKSDKVSAMLAAYARDNGGKAAPAAEVMAATGASKQLVYSLTSSLRAAGVITNKRSGRNYIDREDVFVQIADWVSNRKRMPTTDEICIFFSCTPATAKRLAKEYIEHKTKE